jgi:hypothetical protein
VFKSSTIEEGVWRVGHDTKGGRAFLTRGSKEAECEAVCLLFSWIPLFNFLFLRTSNCKGNSVLYVAYLQIRIKQRLDKKNEKYGKTIIYWKTIAGKTVSYLLDLKDQRDFFSN